MRLHDKTVCREAVCSSVTPFNATGPTKPPRFINEKRKLALTEGEVPVRGVVGARRNH